MAPSGIRNVQRYPRNDTNMSWWAMTFPTSGWGGACIGYHRADPKVYTATIAIVALTIASLIVGWIGVRTVGHIASGAAFRED
jgi:tellurite resistance protein